VKVTLKIQRFNRETDDSPHFQEYPVELEPTDRVLDALMHIKSFLDGSLALRKSCAHGVCGSDAMVINGEERLACKTLLHDVAEEGGTITVEPLRHLPVLRDLMVDQRAFFSRYKAVKPFLINETVVEEKERLQSLEERALFDDPTKCILCGACYSACPVLDGKNPDFIGPAAILQAARFVFDSRDRGFQERLAVLDNPDGVWACENHFRCTQVCPRSIKVTKNINLTKRKITQFKGSAR
jgi:succinate dehydrogenase / fumarate reductase iron-sulfur subunit